MKVDELFERAKSVAIFAHMHPDGDAIGSSLGLYNYIRGNYPDIRVKVFAEAFPEKFRILPGADKIESEYGGEIFDLAFLLDTSSMDRIGANGAECLEKAKRTCNIDHHESNPRNLCGTNIVEPDSSAASETLYTLLSPEKIDRNAANCIYLGIVHDTGAFKFSNTRKRTMDIVGNLIDKGCDFSRIINETFYTRTLTATRITGFAMERCKLALGGKAVYTFVTKEDLEHFDATPLDLASVIDAIREVSGTETAIFLYPNDSGYKISLRSNYTVDVNRVAKEFGGGGHVRAAGASTKENPETAIPKILEQVQKQLS